MSAAAAAAALLSSVQSGPQTSAAPLPRGITLDQADQVQAGVGILMHQDPDKGLLFVKTCVRGGSADRDGRITAGDQITSVENVSLQGMSVQQARAMIVGAQGTTVPMSFERPSGEIYECLLTRGTPEFLDAAGMGGMRQSAPQLMGSLSMPTQPHPSASSEAMGSAPHSLRASRDNDYIGMRSSHDNLNLNHSIGFRASRDNDPYLGRFGGAPSSMYSSRQGNESVMGAIPAYSSTGYDEGGYSAENEVARLRQRVSDLEVENAGVKDELLRTRQVVEQNRDHGLRYVKELELFQRKYNEDVNHLQNLLQESDRVRKELELRLVEQGAKEAEFHDVLKRGQQQTQVREQYFTELRDKYEAELGRADQVVQSEREQKQKADEARQRAEGVAEKLMAEIEVIKLQEQRRRQLEDALRQSLSSSNKQLNETRLQQERCRGCQPSADQPPSSLALRLETGRQHLTVCADHHSASRKLKTNVPRLES